MATKRASLIYQDAQGETSLHLINSASGVSSIRTQILLKSNAIVSEESEGDIVFTSALPSATQYPSSRSNAVLLFKDSRTGSNARIYIPAPIASIFDSAGDTVDPAQVTNLVNACLGNLVAGSGNTVDIFVGGYLSKQRPQPLESTQQVAFVNPMTSKGDLIYSTDSAGDAGNLPIGSTGQVLEVVGGIPAWANPSGLSTRVPSGRAQGTGSADYTTSSTSFVAIDSTNLKVTIAAATNDVILITLFGVMAPTGGTVAVTLDIGGTVVGDTLGLQWTPSTQLETLSIVLQHVVASGEVSGGNVVVTPKFNTSAGTATIYNRTAVSRPYLAVSNLGH